MGARVVCTTGWLFIRGGRVVYGAGGECLDPLRASLVLLTLWVAILIGLAARQLKWGLGYGAVIGVLIGRLVLRFRASHIFIFYIYFEVTLVAIILIIRGWGYQPERVRAGLALIFYTLFASLPFLVIVIFFAECFYVVSFFRGGLCEWAFSWEARLVRILLMVAFLVKLPVYFVHL